MRWWREYRRNYTIGVTWHRDWCKPVRARFSLTGLQKLVQNFQSYNFSAMVQFCSLILALTTITVVLTPSYAWWSRRRRSCSAVRCQVSNWSSWSSCTRSCNGGIRTRTRRKTVTESCGGSCPYHLSNTMNCNTQCCPVDCIYTWGAWSACTGCGNSTQSRSTNIIRQSSCNGTACPAKETQSCYTGV